MERIKILAAAAALHEFTVGELRAFAGVNPNTAQSAIRRGRNDGLFDEASSSGDGSPGRPAKRWQVKDLDRIRSEIRELEAAVDLARVQENRSERDPDQDRLAAIASAEDAIIDGWRAEDADERIVLSQTALAAVAAAHRLMLGEPADTSDAMHRRAADVAVFAQLANLEAQGESIQADGLRQAASALVDLAEVAPERTVPFLLGLSAMAARNDQLLPLALALSQSRKPAEAVMSFEDDAWAEAGPLEDTGCVLWSPRWALPLTQHRLFAGTVVEDSVWEGPGMSLPHSTRWRGPTVVVMATMKASRVQDAAEAGAFCLPSSAGVTSIARTVLSACERMRPIFTSDAEDPSFDFGTLGWRHVTATKR